MCMYVREFCHCISLESTTAVFRPSSLEDTQLRRCEKPKNRSGICTMLGLVG